MPPPPREMGEGPGDLQGTLLKVLAEVRRVAEQNGLDFMELVQMAMRSKVGPPAPPPPPE